MIAVNIDWVIDWENVNKAVALIVGSEEPSSLNITGADVDGLPNDCVIAAGSVLVTPSKNYIAFVDGQFTEKSSSGGGGEGGSGVLALHTPDSATIDKTFREIIEAIDADKYVFISGVNGDPDDYMRWIDVLSETYYSSDDQKYWVWFTSGNCYCADTLDDYPVYQG